ncbi:MAG TPA: hypothetical protein VMV52_08800 [Candidatus Nanopelagicaceae bacterium]|nr:hypothetical protein [Candidatus Nanopelagicaceae bacterium]
MIFFKDRRKLRVVFGFLTSILLFLVVLLAGPIMSVENSDSAQKLVPTLLNNADVRTQVSNKIVDQLASGNAKDRIVKSIRAKRPQFVNAISNALLEPATITELQNDVILGYTFLTTHESTITIQVKPLFATLMAAMSKVDPIFGIAKLVLKDVQPITITRSQDMPKVGTYLSYAQNGYVALVLLFAISLYFYVRFCSSAKRALRAIGIRVFVVGALSIAQFFIIAIIASKFADQASDPLVQTVVPVAARTLFSYYQSIGIALAVGGAAAILISTRMESRGSKIGVESASNYSEDFHELDLSI